ncbi:hypothetical protein ACVWYF_001610 [Hymenobacter sp. UYAg731]
MTVFYQRIRSLLPNHRPARFALGLLLALSAASGCRPAPEAVPVLQDFDSLGGWIPNEPAWLSTAQAHSGQYSCLVAANTEYTPLFKTTFAGIGEPRRVRLRSWAWLPHPGLKVALVLLVRRGNEQLVWESLPLGQIVRRYQQWEPAVRDITLPKTLAPEDEVIIYIWQSSPVRDNLYVDDIRLEKIR